MVVTYEMEEKSVHFSVKIQKMYFTYEDFV